MTFAERLRNARVAAELSQVELGRRAGLSWAYVSMLERGLRQPGSAVALALSQALRKPLSALLGKRP